MTRNKNRKLPLFVEDMKVEVENPKESIHKHVISKIAIHEIDM